MTRDLSPSTPTASSDSAAAAIRIIVNGAPATIDAAATVERLIAEVAPGSTQGLAVALNDAVVPRASWPTQALKPGDTVEIVRATRGG